MPTSSTCLFIRGYIFYNIWFVSWIDYANFCLFNIYSGRFTATPIKDSRQSSLGEIATGPKTITVPHTITRKY